MKKHKTFKFTLNKRTVSNLNHVLGGRGDKTNDCTMRCTIDPPCTDTNTPECQLTAPPGCPDPTIIQAIG